MNDIEWLRIGMVGLTQQPYQGMQYPGIQMKLERPKDTNNLLTAANLAKVLNDVFAKPQARPDVMYTRYTPSTIKPEPLRYHQLGGAELLTSSPKENSVQSSIPYIRDDGTLEMTTLGD